MSDYLWSAEFMNCCTVEQAQTPERKTKMKNFTMSSTPFGGVQLACSSYGSLVTIERWQTLCAFPFPHYRSCPRCIQAHRPQVIVQECELIRDIGYTSHTNSSSSPRGVHRSRRCFSCILLVLPEQSLLSVSRQCCRLLGSIPVIKDVMI